MYFPVCSEFVCPIIEAEAYTTRNVIVIAMGYELSFHPVLIWRGLEVSGNLITLHHSSLFMQQDLPLFHVVI